MQSCNPAFPGCTISYGMVAKHVNKKNAGKTSVLAINALLHSLASWHLIQSLQREMYKKLTLIVFNVFRKTLSLGAPGLDSRPEQKSLGTYHTLPSLYVWVWLVNTLTSTAPTGSPIICMWSPVDICEQWERNLSFGSADVSGAGTRDEPLRTSA